MRPRTAIATSAVVGAVVVAAIIIVAAMFVAHPFTNTITKTVPEITTSVETTTMTVISTSPATLTSSTQQITAPSTCVISGQPGPFYLRVVSDSNQTPVAGAAVAATNEPAYCNGAPLTNQTTRTFITSNNSEWYSLDSYNDAGYSFIVKYLGQTYNFTAEARPLSVTCDSLYVPSGRTNVTITEFQTTCPSTVTGTATG